MEWAKSKKDNTIRVYERFLFYESLTRGQKTIISLNMRFYKTLWLVLNNKM